VSNRKLSASGLAGNIVREIDPFGLEIDFDLNEPLAPAQQAELKELWLKHGLLLFRGQSLPLKEQERVMLYLGPILTNIAERMDYVSTDKALGDFGRGKIIFHFDLAFTPKPFPSISLLAIDLEDGKTSTSFAHSARGYRKMPEALRKRVGGLQVLNCLALDDEIRARDKDLPPFFPRTVHHLVTPHQTTGEPLIYATAQQTDKIFGISEAEGDALLNEVFSYLYAPDNVYEHYWNKGDLIIWDNLALHHARMHRIGNATRTLQRVTGGTQGIMSLYPHMVEYFSAYAAENEKRYATPS
jgi:taurine dioxygenase